MHFNLILSDKIGGRLDRVAAERGFSSPETFIQAVIENELERFDSDGSGKAVYDLLAETLHQLSEQTRRLAVEHRPPDRLIRSLANLIFAFGAELESHTFSEAVSMRSNPHS